MRTYRLLALATMIFLGGEAYAGPRAIVFDTPGGVTSKALQTLGVGCQVTPPADYGGARLSLFDYQVAIWGMDNDQTALNADPQPLLAFVRAGGIFLVMRTQQDCAWVPSPVKLDKAYALGEILKSDHPLFAKPNALTKDALNKVHGGSVYRALYDLGAGWVPLVGTGAEQTWDKGVAASAAAHCGLAELPCGKGRVILCQMIPDYGFLNDDKGQPGASSRMLENLVAYVSSVAPNWPAPGPRVVPVSFHRDLSDVLRAPTARGTLPLSDAAWQVSTQGAYTCQADRRGVLTMSHADRPAAAGSFAQLTRTITVPNPRSAGILPASASSPVFLRFYNSDDYCGGTEPKMVGDARVSTTENRIKDTRFKQVLVNGKVVWEEDALGLNPVPAVRRFHLVDISNCLGQDGQATITLRVEDRKATPEDQPFATDVYWAGVDLLPGIVQTPVDEGQNTAKVTFTGAQGQYAVLVRALDEHTGNAKLQASVDAKPLGSARLTANDYTWYWISLGLTDLKPGSAVTVKATPDGGEAGAMQALAFVPASLLAVPSLGAPTSSRLSSPLFKPTPLVARATFPVLVSGPEPYKPQGEVVSGGMPFAYGAVKSERNLRLLNDQDREVPLQTRVLATWPDGSLKWVLFTFPTGPGEVRCEYGTAATRETSKGLTVTQDDQTISINTGPLQVTISKTNGDLCQTLALEGKTLKTADTAWPLTLSANGKQYSSLGNTVTRCELLEAGPERALVRRVGRLRAEDGSTLLEYDVTQEFTLNSGVMRVKPALTHKEASAEEKLALLTLTLNTPWLKEENTTVWSGDKLLGVRGGLGQDSDERGMFGGKTKDGILYDGLVKRDPGLFRLAGQGAALDVAPRWFWQMYPGTISASSSGLAMSWASGLTIHQGEALWNDFALRFSTDTGQPKTADFDALANPAVALADPQYTASTLALGQFMPQNEAVFPEYEDTVEGCYKAYLAKREARHEYGAENFGDDTFEWGYGPSYTFWSNQEYDHHYGMLLQFLRSGDWRWWEIGDQGARHHVNVDCYHFAPPGQEYLIGSPHHHNAKHIVETGWYPDHTVAGSDVSHSWVEGQLAYYFMTGDQRTLENWRAMGDWYVWCVNNNRYGAGGQERGPGWTLVALSALYNATHERKYLDAGNKVMDWLRSVQDPVRGVISIPISEQPSYEGGSAFMHGIVARGAGRWYDATGDERGKLATVGIADWLTAEAMGPPALFYYKQAPRIKGTYSISEWQCFSALTYAMKYGDPGYYGPLAQAHFQSGRAGERSMAWVPQDLAQLQERFWPYRAKWVDAQAVVAPGAATPLKVSFVNASPDPLSILVKVKSAPAGVTVVVPPTPVSVAARGTAEVMVSVSVHRLQTASGTLQLELTGAGQSRLLEVPMVAVPVLVKIQKSAAEGQLQPPFALDKDKAAVAARDASFTGNPRQPGERVGWVAWEIEVPVAGSYLLSADCWWLDDKGNSLYLQVDDGPEVTFGNDGDLTHWHTVRAPEALKLAAGKHTLRLLNREDGARVRGILLTNTQ